MIQLVAVLAAIGISILLVVWALKVIKETLITGILVGVILVVLFVGLEITPAQIYDAFLQLPELLRERVQSLRSS